MLQSHGHAIDFCPRRKKSRGARTQSSAAGLPLRRHLSALFGATAASPGALLAMIVFVFFTFLSAFLAQVRAQRADGGGVDGITSHEAGGHATKDRAVNVRRDAVGHHCDVALAKAGGGAVVACVGAVVAGLDAGLVFVMSHDDLGVGSDLVPVGKPGRAAAAPPPEVRAGTTAAFPNRKRRGKRFVVKRRSSSTSLPPSRPCRDLPRPPRWKAARSGSCPCRHTRCPGPWPTRGTRPTPRTT